ncbi:MAG: family acetyltransferase [Bacillota bacterium]|nr:family acetyltransferase [Bacillota bacterium]
MEIISVRERPEYKFTAIRYFQEKWADADSEKIYEDCILHCIDAHAPLPQWYLLCAGDEIVGCAGLITNDFISRMDLYPWVCALFIEDQYRGRGYGALLLEKAKKDAIQGGFETLYLCTDHIGYYEQYGFSYIGEGYHPWGTSSRVYAAKTGPEKEHHSPEYNKPNLILPISLHDGRLNLIKIEGDEIIFILEDGFRTIKNGNVSETGRAAISFPKVDFDFCEVSCIGKDGYRQKWDIQDFAVKLEAHRYIIDIIDETYGYNQAKYSCNMTHQSQWFQCLIEIYHFGEMKYTWEEPSTNGDTLLETE